MLNTIFTAIFKALVITILVFIGAYTGLNAVEKYRVMHPDENTEVYIYNLPPPTYVLVKGERWYINPSKHLDKNTGMYAYTNCDLRVIVYDEGLVNPLLRESIWHELAHAELCYKNLTTKANWKLSVDGEEHDVIYPLSMAQISFMHDNPEFMKWMGNW